MFVRGIESYGRITAILNGIVIVRKVKERDEIIKNLVYFEGRDRRKIIRASYDDDE